MMILSNCLSDKTDEGCLKLANSLIKRIKQRKPETTVISYGESTLPGDLYLKANKLMLSPSLLWLVWKKKEPLLYIPAVAKAHTMALRVFLLSLFARRGMSVVQVMQYRTGTIPRLLLKASKAKLIMFSADSWRYYDAMLNDQSCYLRTGVNTEKFCPVSGEKKRELREKYRIPQDKKIVLHIGHMRPGRNLETLALLKPPLHGLVVSSSYSADTQDQALRQRLLENPNITVIDTYLPHVEEIYQLSDLYLFPVLAAHNCIDVPLSALEAAACNLPVVTTAYGELKELLGKDGFYEIQSFEPDSLNHMVWTALEEKKQPRSHVLSYDWELAVEKLLQMTEAVHRRRKD